MYDNEFETKDNKIWTKDKIEPRIKLNHNIDIDPSLQATV